jgi:hypothetical protein
VDEDGIISLVEELPRPSKQVRLAVTGGGMDRQTAVGFGVGAALEQGADALLDALVKRFNLHDCIPGRLHHLMPEGTGIEERDPLSEVIEAIPWRIVGRHK